MNNYKDAQVGKRIKLLDTMINENSEWMPKEDLPIGLEGTISYVSINGNLRLDQIGVFWDNGRTLGIFPYKDKYQILN